MPKVKKQAGKPALVRIREDIYEKALEKAKRLGMSTSSYINSVLVQELDPAEPRARSELDVSPLGEGIDQKVWFIIHRPPGSMASEVIFGHVSTVKTPRVVVRPFKGMASITLFAKEIEQFWEAEGDPIWAFRSAMEQGLGYGRSLMLVQHLLPTEDEVMDASRKAWNAWAKRSASYFVALTPDTAQNERNAACGRPDVESWMTLDARGGRLVGIAITTAEGTFSAHSATLEGGCTIHLDLTSRDGEAAKSADLALYPIVLGLSRLHVHTVARDAKGPRQVFAAFAEHNALDLHLPLWCQPFAENILLSDGMAPSRVPDMRAFPELRVGDPYCRIQEDRTGKAETSNVFPARAVTIPAPHPKLDPATPRSHTPSVTYPSQVRMHKTEGEGTDPFAFRWRLPGAHRPCRIRGVQFEADEQMAFVVRYLGVSYSPNLVVHEPKVTVDERKARILEELVAYPVLLEGAELSLNLEGDFDADKLLVYALLEDL